MNCALAGGVLIANILHAEKWISVDPDNLMRLRLCSEVGKQGGAKSGIKRGRPLLQR